MYKKLFIALLAATFLLGSNAFAEKADSASAESNIEQLKQEVSTLKLKLEKMYIEQVDNNPYATGQTLDWGTGWSFFINLSPAYDITMDMAYMFQFSSWHAPWEPEYIDKRKGYRVGISAGLQSFHHGETLYNDDDEAYRVAGFGLHARLIYGSPVLLNFISTTGYIKPMVIFPQYHSNDSRKEEPLMGIGLGADIEFWIAENKCISLGFKAEGIFKDMFDDPLLKEDSVMPFLIKPLAGVKIYF